MACSIIGCIISILMGYDTGVMSGAMLFIKEDLKTNDTQVQVLAGILNVCALVGSLTAGRVSDRIGCRRTISLAACIFLAGSVLMGLAPNFATLLAGRCVAGVGVGYALMIAPVYAAEMSSAKIRGSLTSLPEICISFGILLGYVANFLLAKLPLVYGWRTMLGLGALPSTVLAVSVLAMPESPRWLVMQGRPDEEALAVLRRVYSDAAGEADVQLAEIKAAAGESASKGKGALLAVVLYSPRIEAVMLYSPRIFKVAGIATTMRSWRRPSAWESPRQFSSCRPSCWLPAAALPLQPCQHQRLALLPWHSTALAIGTVFTFVASFSVGLGPITWAYSSEVYPLQLRAQGASVGVAINRLMNTGVSMTFVTLYKAITIGGAFFLFAGLAVVAAAFFYFVGG